MCYRHRAQKHVPYSYSMGLIIGLLLSSGQWSSCVIKAVCALLDFLYLAQFLTHTMQTLQYLNDSLVLFH